jgi:hypothetical protein
VERLARIVERPAALALALLGCAFRSGRDERGDAAAHVCLQLLLRRRFLRDVAPTDEIDVVLGAVGDGRDHRPEADGALRVDQAIGWIAAPVAGQPVAERLIAGDGAFVDVERHVEVGDRGRQQLVEQKRRVRREHQVPAFA